MEDWARRHICSVPDLDKRFLPGMRKCFSHTLRSSLFIPTVVVAEWKVMYRKSYLVSYLILTHLNHTIFTLDQNHSGGILRTWDWILDFPALWLRTAYLCFSLFMYKIRTIISTLQSFLKDQIRLWIQNLSTVPDIHKTRAQKWFLETAMVKN